MKRTRLLAILAIAAVAGLVVTGCKSPMGLTPDQDTRTSSHWVLHPEVDTIWAGPHYNVGAVTVWNTPDSLYITYTTTGHWWLAQTQTHVALKLKNIPQTRGAPDPDRFEFQHRWRPRVQTCTLAIANRNGWDVGDTLYIATHSVVDYVDNHGRVTQEEDGWAGPYFFNYGSGLCCNRERYIKYQLKSAYKDVNLPPLPTDSAKMAVYQTEILSYFDVVLDSVPVGYPVPYDVYNGHWLGWCAEHSVGIVPSGLIPGDITWYHVHFWSSEDPLLPDMPLVDKNAWPNVNYLLNHKLTGATAHEIQVALWWLLTPSDSVALRSDAPLVGNAKVMHDSAMLYGNNWHPSKGQVLAVICDAPPIVGPWSKDPMPIQRVFIEVDP